MDKNVSYPAISNMLKKYPKAAGALFTTYNDLSLSQQWDDLEVLDVPSCARGAIRGRRPGTDVRIPVIPCAMADSLSLGWVSSALADLGDPPEIYLAISTEDSSIVYYKISRGFVKPPL